MVTFVQAFVQANGGQAKKVEAGTELLAASSNLWKFAKAAAAVSGKDIDRKTFRASQKILGPFLMKQYKAPTLKNVDLKIGALGARMKNLAKAFAENKDLDVIKIKKSAKLSFSQIGVLFAITLFYAQFDGLDEDGRLK